MISSSSVIILLGSGAVQEGPTAEVGVAPMRVSDFLTMSSRRSFDSSSPTATLLSLASSLSVASSVSSFRRVSSNIYFVLLIPHYGQHL